MWQISRTLYLLHDIWSNTRQTTIIMPENVSIPQPPTHAYGFLGNLPDIDPSFAIKSLRHLSELYGPIYQLDFVSNRVIVVSSYELAHEVFNDERFEKFVSGSVKVLRALSGDALFTAYNHELVSCTQGNRLRQRRTQCERGALIDRLTAIELAQSSPHSHACLWTLGCTQNVSRAT